MRGREGEREGERESLQDQYLLSVQYLHCKPRVVALGVIGHVDSVLSEQRKPTCPVQPSASPTSPLSPPSGPHSSAAQRNNESGQPKKKQKTKKKQKRGVSPNCPVHCSHLNSPNYLGVNLQSDRGSGRLSLSLCMAFLSRSLCGREMIKPCSSTLHVL